jgi:membrane AbrB-like protein
MPKPVLARFAQPVIAAVMGFQVTPAILEQSRVFFTCTGFIILNSLVICTLLLILTRRIARLDPVTAFLCAVPGALTQITALLDEHRADQRLVSLIHTSRQSVFLLGVPVLLVIAGHRVTTGPSVPGFDGRLTSFAVLAFCATAGPQLARRLRLPTPSVLGPLLIAAGVSLAGLGIDKAPSLLMIPAQLALGAWLGERFGGMDRRAIARHLPLLLAANVFMATFVVVAAILLDALTNCSFAAALLFLVPGGLSETSLIAMSLGISPDQVAMQHGVRLLLLYFAVPISLTRLWLPFAHSRRQRSGAEGDLRVGTECLDIFSPPPGNRDVISQTLRDSSSETKNAPSAVRIAAGAGRGASSGIVASRVGGPATSLSKSNDR